MPSFDEILVSYAACALAKHTYLKCLSSNAGGRTVCKASDSLFVRTVRTCDVRQKGYKFITLYNFGLRPSFYYLPTDNNQEKAQPSTAMPGMQQYRPLFSLPELQQDWHTQQEDRDVTWPELFFDLFVVAAVSNLSHLFGEHPAASSAGRVLLYHALVFFIWSDYAMIKTRYRLHGLHFRCIGLILQLGTLAVIIGIRDDVTWYRLLAGGYAVARAATATLYAILAATIPRARALSLLNLFADALPLLLGLWLAVPEYSSGRYPTFVAVFVGVAVLEAAVPLLPSLLQAVWDSFSDIPLHVEHMNERLGQLIMLHLGEAVIGFAMSPLADTFAQFVAVGLAATLIWCLHLVYYHMEPKQHVHAYRQSRIRGLLYFYCHWPLAVALLLTGSALRSLLGMYPGRHNAPLLQLLFSTPGPRRTTNNNLSGQETAAEARKLAWWEQEEEWGAPPAPFDVSLMLCIAYAASLHLLALIRAAHYFSLDPEHRVVQHHKARGVSCWYYAWWATLWMWPLPVYFLPLAVRMVNEAAGKETGLTSSELGLGFTTGGLGSGFGHQGFSVTLLLGLLTGHAVVLTCAESVFAHKITRTPILEGLGAQEDSAPDGATGS